MKDETMTDTAGRIHGLDLLRAVAMLLGIVLHAPLVLLDDEAWSGVLAFYGQPETPRPVAEPWVYASQLMIHIWRMPVFFILAGFFAALVIERRGWWAFLKDRLLRITATLVLFMAVFQVAFSLAFGDMNHLWFLWHLTVFCAVTAFWHRMGWPRGCALTGRRLLWLLPVAMALALIFRGDQVWHPLATNIFDPMSLIAMAYYAPFFVIGQGLWHGRGTLATLAGGRSIGLWLGLGVAGCAGLVIDLADTWPALIRAILSGAATVGLSLGMIGLFQRLLTRRTALVDWLVDGAYPIYVFHLYPIMMIAAMAYLAGASQAMTVVAATLGGFAASVVLWYILVRWTPVDILMNGPKRSRFLALFARRRAHFPP